MLKHYAIFFFEGKTSEAKEIISRDIPVEIPDGAYAYQLFDQTEETLVNGSVRKGEKTNVTELISVNGNNLEEKISS